MPVRLLFGKPRRENAGSWVVLLCTGTGYSDERILETYALRWSIEIYFKEAKQAMDWLAEQPGSYASIHLAAIRYMPLLSLALDGGGTPRSHLDVLPGGKDAPPPVSPARKDPSSLL